MKNQSVCEVGTLKYFQERIMRHNVYSDIKKDVNGFQEFYLSGAEKYATYHFCSCHIKYKIFCRW